MRQKLKYLVALGLIVPVMAFGPIVLAHEGEEQTETANQSDTEKQKTLTERIEKNKDQFKIKLRAAEILALKGKCGSAQTKVKTHIENVSANVPARVKAYQNLYEHLNNLVARLEAKDVDTTTLKEQLETLDQKIHAFDDDLETYKQSLGDLKDINCVADPDGFKAALEAARADRQALTEDMAAIKAYVKDTIKPTLQQIRDQLKTQEESN